MENDVQIDEIEQVSKTQLKRESHAIQDLGKKLVGLSADQLARIPLDAVILEAVTLAHRIQNKRSALKRHYQFLGKLLRARDTDPIFAALAEFDNESQLSLQKHHRAERWRDRIIEQGNDAIDALVDEITHTDRQKLRQLWRNHQNATTDGRRIQHSRLIYKEIKQSLDTQPES
jgi:ribosome-associated protein